MHSPTVRALRHATPEQLAQHHPSVVEVAQQIGSNAQLRAAAAITWFAGSMWFVYLHAVVFTLWMLLLEKSPWPTLTLIVSLEAIFLSTFVMIGQNRQALFAEKKADHDFTAQELELHTNTDLTRQIAELARQIADLTLEIHTQVVPATEPPGITGSSAG
jgi:uncharacterized membrane protein